MTIKVELNILIFTEFLQIRSDFTKALSVISTHQICDLDHLKFVIKIKETGDLIVYQM
ncbi:MAG: hypothetical protein ACKPEN_19365 [Planktothrix sp.]|uniref:hypothetical protein n=1 Tax=Planktothrix sp. TaxID=3088171 RepID=UPI0038D3C447